ncbi:MAG: hypothetical protein U0P45_00460 [Acidimicrobiales bacterium]
MTTTSWPWAPGSFRTWSTSTGLAAAMAASVRAWMQRLIAESSFWGLLTTDQRSSKRTSGTSPVSTAWLHAWSMAAWSSW